MNSLSIFLYIVSVVAWWAGFNYAAARASTTRRRKLFSTAAALALAWPFAFITLAAALATKAAANIMITVGDHINNTWDAAVNDEGDTTIVTKLTPMGTAMRVRHENSDTNTETVTETHPALADDAAKTAARATKKARAIHHNIRTATPTADAPRSAATTGTEEHPAARRNAGAPGNRDTNSQAANQGRNRNNQNGNNDTPTTARIYNATSGEWENTDIHKLPAGTVLHSSISNYYRTSDHLHTHRVGPWVSDSGLTITSSDLAAQIRRQWEGNNAYYTAITPTAMNTLSQ